MKRNRLDAIEEQSDESSPRFDFGANNVKQVEEVIRVKKKYLRNLALSSSELVEMRQHEVYTKQ